MGSERGAAYIVYHAEEESEQHLFQLPNIEMLFQAQ